VVIAFFADCAVHVHDFWTRLGFEECSEGRVNIPIPKLWSIYAHIVHNFVPQV